MLWWQGYRKGEFEMKSTFYCAVVLWAGATNLSASVIFSEGFDSAASLSGSGWTITNNSTPGGQTTWYQGEPTAFSSQTGADNSYIAANYLNAPDPGLGGGDISDWLITPLLSLDNGETFTFYTRTENPQLYADRLEVRLSTNGSSGNVGSTTTSTGDFNTLLLTVNQSLTVTGYPGDWTLETITLSGLGGPVSGRLAFRYFVPDTAVNGDYIGIDTVSLSTATSSAPEPGSLVLFCAGIGGIVFLRRNRRQIKSV